MSRKAKKAKAGTISPLQILEGKLREARTRRDEKREEFDARRKAHFEKAGEQLTGLNTEIHRIEEAIRAERAAMRRNLSTEASQPGRMSLDSPAIDSASVDRIPGAVDTDGSGKVTKAPTVSRVRDQISRLPLSGPVIATAREFQALFQKCAYGDMRAANMERVGVGAKPVVIDFVEDRRAEMNRLFRLVGGMSTPMGSILYHVVGMEDSIPAWCARQVSDGKITLTPADARGILIGALAHLHVIWSFRHIMVLEDAVRGQLLKVGRRQGVPA